MENKRREICMKPSAVWGWTGAIVGFITILLMIIGSDRQIQAQINTGDDMIKMEMSTNYVRKEDLKTYMSQLTNSMNEIKSNQSEITKRMDMIILQTRK